MFFGVVSGIITLRVFLPPFMLRDRVHCFASLLVHTFPSLALLYPTSAFYGVHSACCFYVCQVSSLRYMPKLLDPWFFFFTKHPIIGSVLVSRISVIFFIIFYILPMSSFVLIKWLTSYNSQNFCLTG